jgi:hypothetical protein
MNNKKTMILVSLFIIIVISFILYLLLKPEKKEIAQNEQETPYKQEKQELYLDVPKPNLDPEEVFKLWPDLQNPQRVNKEEIEKQWIEFARKYPNNFYIPTKYLNLTEEQLQQRQKELETFTYLESKYASIKSKLNKEAQPGVDGPEAIKEINPEPEEQRTYFQYKVKELQSRIELIEYWLENEGANLNSQQKELAEQDLQQWKKELNEYNKLLKEIPLNKK